MSSETFNVMSREEWNDLSWREQANAPVERMPYNWLLLEIAEWRHDMDERGERLDPVEDARCFQLIAECARRKACQEVVFVVEEKMVEWNDLPWHVRAATPYEKWPLTALQARDQWYLDAESNGYEFIDEELADWRQVDMAILYLEDLAYRKK